jgi:multimeric flavodoxin WrbA
MGPAAPFEAMKRLLIVYHSQTGNTWQLARAALSGARQQSEVETRLVHASEAALRELLWCDGLLIGTPENFGFLAGAIKDFFDRTFYPAQGKLRALPYAVFVSAGNDGSGAVRQLERIARGYPLTKVAEAVIARGAIGDSELEACRELGQTLAAGLELGSFG